jgi:hypothetical protein
VVNVKNVISVLSVIFYAVHSHPHRNMKKCAFFSLQFTICSPNPNPSKVPIFPDPYPQC